mmetsp:Transcript_22942/g.44759  ORF Transcript_22942/g.44759 Transcript_22942/m.44759 type:complete len:92 (+) Transcript_22942:1-276(+)
MWSWVALLAGLSVLQGTHTPPRRTRLSRIAFPRNLIYSSFSRATRKALAQAAAHTEPDSSSSSSSPIAQLHRHPEFPLLAVNEIDYDIWTP